MPPRFRPAKVDDTEHIVELLIPLFQKFGGVYGIRSDAESIVKTVLHTITNGICLVSPEACAGGFIHPYPWNHQMNVGVVLFWNYNRPSGIRVFEALTREFKARGATHINCASHFPDHRIGRHYRRLNLQPAEIQYVGPVDSATIPLATSRRGAK